MDLNFPPVDIMEELKQNDCDFQTFDLITYEKDSVSINQWEKCEGLCNCFKNNIGSYAQYAENKSICESDTDLDIKITSPNTDKLVKRQNNIIKKLSKEIEQLKRKKLRGNYLDSNKSLALLRSENQTLMQRIEKLQNEMKTIGKDAQDKATRMQADKDTFKERKELIEFMFRNEGKMVLFTTTIRELIWNLIINKDAPDHLKLIRLVENLKDPVVDSSSSVLESYSSRGAFQVRNSLNCQNTGLLRWDSRNKLYQSNEKYINISDDWVTINSQSDKENRGDVRDIGPSKKIF